MRIGIIGTGAIAAAVVEGIAGDGHRITVSERSRTRSGDLAARFPNVTVADNQAAIDASDVVLIGLMADAARDVLASLRFREGQRVVSLMADVTLDDIAPIVAPAVAAVVMIPFPAISNGGSPILTFGDTALIEDLAGHRNTVVPVATEAELGAYMAAQSVASGAALVVAEAKRWLAPQVGDPEAADAFLRRLVTSAFDAQGAEEVLSSLDTPGGYNQRMRNALQGAGTADVLHATFDRLSGNS
ncbi:NAD(P)-binding domain-containing protein [Palleronia sp.]|uniref:NAD(P)-binding domain-containing protein n=1 Tax=Palleronia sp. TaxID=1940284 RepID=UPI0035C83B88